MRDPAELYKLNSDVDTVGLVMLVVLDGFVDAGSAGRQAADALFDHSTTEEVATFDVDRLVDYRSRRPTMTFVENTWTEYSAPTLGLYLLRDAEETPFLVLYGMEPDREWEAFVAAVRELAERLSVSLTIGVHGIPMAVPHTRPATATAHATRPELIAGHTSWIGRVRVPGSAASLLEYRFGEAGHDFIGYAIHVPSYLSQAEYPRAAITGLGYVADTTGLALPTEALEEAARNTDTEIEEQVAASEEVQRVVSNLEQQYDDYMSAREATDDSGALLSGDESALPSAEELGAELERYLANREGNGEG